MATKTRSLHIALPAKMRKYVEEQSERQNYSTKSDFIQDIIRKDMKMMEQEKLEKMLLEGLASGSVHYDGKKWVKSKKKILEKV